MRPSVDVELEPSTGRDDRTGGNRPGTGAAWTIPRVTIIVGAGAVPKIRGLKRP